MMRSALAVICAALVSASCSEPAQQPPYPPVDAQNIRTHVERLEAAKAAGTEAGSRGEQLAAQYVEETLREIGLNVRTQTVPLTRIVAKNGSMRLTAAAGARTFAAGKDFVAWTRRRAPVAAVHSEVVFVGYGISTQSQGWDDYKGVDVRGKILVMLIGEPLAARGHLPEGAGQNFYGQQAYKLREAERRGAAATFLVYLDRKTAASWDEIVRVSANVIDLGSPANAAAEAPVEGWVTLEAARDAFRIAGLDLDKLRDAADQPNFTPVTVPLRGSVEIATEITAVTSKNVVATLGEVGPATESVIFSSNWNSLLAADSVDGLRTAEPAGDRPSAVAVMIEVARALASKPLPGRAFVFLSVTADSQGLLGLDHYLANPVHPLDKARAGIHISGFSPRSDQSQMSIVAYTDEALKELVRTQAAVQFRSATADRDQRRQYFFTWAETLYTEKEIPSIFLTSALPPESALSQSAADFSVGVLDAQLAYHVGHRVATTGNWPDWKPLRAPRVTVPAPKTEPARPGRKTR